MNYRNFADLNNDIRLNFQKIADQKVDVVVGLPRSGMIPAYMIALLMNIDCTDFQSFLDNKPLKRGSTRGAKNQLTHPQDAENILIVDDSVNTGSSMEKARAQIPEHLLPKVKVMAVYSGTRIPQSIDFYLKYIAQPRVFEWNIFGHHILQQACLDIDGVVIGAINWLAAGHANLLSLKSLAFNKKHRLAIFIVSGFVLAVTLQATPLFCRG